MVQPGYLFNQSCMILISTLSLLKPLWIRVSSPTKKQSTPKNCNLGPANSHFSLGIQMKTNGFLELFLEFLFPFFLGYMQFDSHSVWGDGGGTNDNSSGPLLVLGSIE